MSFDSNTKLWDLETGKELITLRGHAGFVYSGIFSADGHSSSPRASTARYGSGTGPAASAMLANCRAAGRFTQVAFRPDGNWLAWISGKSTGSGQLGVWDVVSDKSIFVNTDARLAFLSVAFSPDGRQLAVGTGERAARLDP